MTERSSEGLSERQRKLLFRAWRRGVREMDLIVGRFADAYIDKLDEPALVPVEIGSGLPVWVSAGTQLVVLPRYYPGKKVGQAFQPDRPNSQAGKPELH